MFLPLHTTQTIVPMTTFNDYVSMPSMKWKGVGAGGKTEGNTSLYVSHLKLLM